MVMVNARAKIAGRVLHAMLAWGCVLAVPALLASVLHSALVEVVSPSVERSHASGAIVATGPPTPRTAYGAEEVTPAAIRLSSLSRAAPIVATIAFMNDDGSVGTLSCRTRTNREDSVYFPDAAHAMDVYARLCTGADSPDE